MSNVKLARIAIGHRAFEDLIAINSEVESCLVVDICMRLTHLDRLLATPALFSPTTYFELDRAMVRIFRLGMNRSQYSLSQEASALIDGTLEIPDELRVLASLVFESESAPSDTIVPVSPFPEDSEDVMMAVHSAREDYMTSVCDRYSFLKYYLACPNCGNEVKEGGKPVQLHRELVPLPDAHDAGGQAAMLAQSWPDRPETEIRCQNIKFDRSGKPVWECKYKGRGVVNMRVSQRRYDIYWAWFKRIHLLYEWTFTKHVPLKFQLTPFYWTINRMVLPPSSNLDDRSGTDTEGFAGKRFTLLLI